MRNASRSAEGGFTLIETLIAMIILIVGIVAVSNLLAVAATSSATGNRSTGATTAASQQIEQLMTVPIDSLTTGGSVTADVGGYNKDQDMPGIGTIHTRWQVTVLTTNPQTGLPTLVYIQVTSQAQAHVFAALSQAQFTTFRARNATW